MCPKGLDKEEDRLSALAYFNQIGTLINFSEDLNLSDVIFLQPHWITTAIYSLLDSKNNIEHGKFTKDEIYNFWQKEKKYTKADCNNLLKLMLKDKLNIAYKLDEEKYIVPMLLPSDPPAQYDWSYKDNISIKIEYEFIPSPIILDLIVSVHNLIFDNFVWSEGVILKDKKSNTTALIIQENKKLLKINVADGSYDGQKKLLEKIRSEIEIIHNKLYGLEINYKELVKCNCYMCIDSSEPYYFDMKVLQHFTNHLLNQTDIQCYESGEQVSIKDLIRTVYKEEDIQKGLSMTKLNFYGTGNKFQVGNGNTMNINEQNITKQSVAEVLQELEQHKSELGLTDEQRKTLNDDTDDIKKEIEKQEPNKNFVINKFKKIYAFVKNNAKDFTADVCAKVIENFLSNP